MHYYAADLGSSRVTHMHDRAAATSSTCTYLRALTIATRSDLCDYSPAALVCGIRVVGGRGVVGHVVHNRHLYGHVHVTARSGLWGMGQLPGVFAGICIYHAC